MEWMWVFEVKPKRCECGYWFKLKTHEARTSTTCPTKTPNDVKKVIVDQKMFCVKMVRNPLCENSFMCSLIHAEVKYTG